METMQRVTCWVAGLSTMDKPHRRQLLVHVPCKLPLSGTCEKILLWFAAESPQAFCHCS